MEDTKSSKPSQAITKEQFDLAVAALVDNTQGTTCPPAERRLLAEEFLLSASAVGFGLYHLSKFLKMFRI